MSWGAQTLSKDAKTPSVAGVRLIKPELDCCPIQPYINSEVTVYTDCTSPVWLSKNKIRKHTEYI
jgi:hypothetical protein